MMELPVWVWVVSALGVIAVGVGLGYLIIFLFWKIEQLLGPPVPPAPPPPPEEQVEEPEPMEEPEPEPEEEPLPETADEPTEEELAPVMLASMSDEDRKYVKFTTVLHARFKHPFAGVRIIACWEIGLEEGDEIRDADGNVLVFRVTPPDEEDRSPRYFLADEAGKAHISVISGKEYIRQETQLDVDKIRLPR
jgi:hypothetical protein